MKIEPSVDNPGDADCVAAFQRFEGRGVEPFREVAARLPSTPESFLRLLSMASSPDAAVQIGATWVIKHFLERGVEPPRAMGGAAVRLLGEVEAPEAALHLLQILPMLRLSRRDLPWLYEVLTDRMADRNKFVRAWVFNAFAILARLDPDRYRRQVLDLLEAAEATESASVKARIRRARKENGLGA